MTAQPLRPHDIERWVPQSLQDIVGCDNLKAVLTDMIAANGFSPNLLVNGAAGTGKTSSIKATVRTLMCARRGGDTQLPCGECDSCRFFDARYPDQGLFEVLRASRQGVSPIHYFPVNCGEITESELRELVRDTRSQYGLVIIYLDEVHRIVRRQMDHLLLKPLEEHPAVWIASSASLKDLSVMFKRRFTVRVATTSPTFHELVGFLEARCRGWQLNVDSRDTLGLIAQLSRLIPSRAIGALAIGAGRPGRILTKETAIAYFRQIEECEASDG